jgi:2-dehydropantoate 2-reductase
MQNGIGVEQPLIDVGFEKIYRCVLYATGQTAGDHQYRFREVAESPVGIVHGSTSETHAITQRLSTPLFRFYMDNDIQKQVWKKAILNTAFNSICPLINVDNGIFHRDDAVAAIAQTIIEEAQTVAKQIGIHFEKRELMEQLHRISRSSDGQLISTLQDINHGKETEIDFLNLAIARIGSSLKPPIDAKITRVLGELILAKSRLSCNSKD